MVPELYINDILVADLPDENNTYTTESGKIQVNVDGINADEKVQTIVVGGDALGGTRSVQLSPSGEGSQMISSDEKLKVALKDRPIRKTERRVVGRGQSIAMGNRWSHPKEVEVSKTVWRNPKWVRSSAQ